ncbi:MAG TPA: Trm112 family protein [Candidatus Nanoarchaeia archaeon]|nr:Trm112 family protein [Candidatus Nanoarchaeia archaeon]
MNKDLLGILACTCCKGRLRLVKKSLMCTSCRAVYPLKAGIPVFCDNFYK